MHKLSKILGRFVNQPKRTLPSTDTRHWTFDNGVKCYRKYFLDLQLDRYATVNIHEPEEEEIFCTILEKYEGDGIFLDVGAAWGYYSFLARKLCPEIEIHAINPDDYFVQAMRDNMSLNEVHDVRIHPVAISDSVGKCRIVSGSYGDRIKRGNQVDKTTIDNFLGDLSRDVYLMKMDIQGEELRALKGSGASFPRIKHLIVGTHGKETHDGCVDLLTSNGCEIQFQNWVVANQPDGIIAATGPS